MPELIPWSGEPGEPQLIVLFSGSRAELREGLSAWLQHGGDAGLSGSPLPAGVRLPWTPGEENWLLSIGAPPQYAMLGWWLRRRPAWNVFYRSAQTPGDADAERAAPSGTFVPWGSALAVQSDGERARLLVWHGGEHIAIPDRLDNAFEAFDRKEALAFAARAAAVRASLPGPGRRSEEFEIRLRTSVARDPLDPRSEIERLRGRIREMEEQAETLEMLASDQPVDAFAWLYRETEHPEVGTQWDLRRWFVSAPAEAVAEFVHARVDVEDLGTVHVLKPSDTRRGVRFEPPDAAWTLRLARPWHCARGDVLVEDGLELSPAPPRTNAHVRDLLHGALWHECEAGSDLLLVLRHRQRDVRFAMREVQFGRLSDHIDELNRHVALATLDRTPSTRNTTGRILDEIQSSLREHLQKHAESMTALLTVAWDGARAGIDAEQARVAEAERNRGAIRSACTEIDELHKRVATLKDAEWNAWTKVLSSMVQADRRLIPAQRGDVAGSLARIDECRAEVASLWRSGGERARRRDLAGRLHAIADELDR